MRTFIAIELPKNIKDFLVRLQDQLKKSRADVKWVQPQNIHLTLKFLGEIDEQKLDKIVLILEEITKTNNSFYIRISSLGAFPKIRFPRVIWVGIDKGDMETAQIAKVLEEEIAKIGIPPEKRPFSSHITIGRVRSNLNQGELAKNLDDLANSSLGENLEFLVTKIMLFKSTLTPKGPIYEVLKEAYLKTS
jgi:2'-5' RNA ligase